VGRIFSSEGGNNIFIQEFVKKPANLFTNFSRTHVFDHQLFSFELRNILNYCKVCF
jgi:hypothetical protein